MCFQPLSNLLPRLSALENVSSFARLCGVKKASVARRALEALGKLEISRTAVHHLPNNCSGGRSNAVRLQERLQIIRTFINGDEPTGTL
ncbi:hypothetical protein CW304_21695 [Bacillus sp. UFRGS-B20]|nr:hypothetical protein CW304_21695 [Bacillus sp. UFRGS-B20]